MTAQCQFVLCLTADSISLCNTFGYLTHPASHGVFLHGFPDQIRGLGMPQPLSPARCLHDVGGVAHGLNTSGYNHVGLSGGNDPGKGEKFRPGPGFRDIGKTEVRVGM